MQPEFGERPVPKHAEVLVTVFFEFLANYCLENKQVQFYEKGFHIHTFTRLNFQSIFEQAKKYFNFRIILIIKGFTQRHEDTTQGVQYF